MKILEIQTIILVILLIIVLFYIKKDIRNKETFKINLFDAAWQGMTVVFRKPFLKEMGNIAGDVGQAIPRSVGLGGGSAGEWRGKRAFAAKKQAEVQEEPNIPTLTSEERAAIQEGIRMNIEKKAEEKKKQAAERAKQDDALYEKKVCTEYSTKNGVAGESGFFQYGKENKCVKVKKSNPIKNLNKRHCPTGYTPLLGVTDQEKKNCEAAAKALYGDDTTFSQPIFPGMKKKWSRYCSMSPIKDGKVRVMYGGRNKDVKSCGKYCSDDRYLCRKKQNEETEDSITLSKSIDGVEACPKDYKTIDKADECKQASKKFFGEADRRSLDMNFIDPKGSKKGGAQDWGKRCQTAGYKGGGGDCGVGGHNPDGSDWDAPRCNLYVGNDAREKYSGGRIGGVGTDSDERRSIHGDLPKPYKYICKRKINSNQ